MSRLIAHIRAIYKQLSIHSLFPVVQLCRDCSQLFSRGGGWAVWWEDDLGVASESKNIVFHCLPISQIYSQEFTVIEQFRDQQVLFLHNTPWLWCQTEVYVITLSRSSLEYNKICCNIMEGDLSVQVQSQVTHKVQTAIKLSSVEAYLSLQSIHVQAIIRLRR